MARKEKTVTITADGRDRGKVFHIREMPAARAERWAARALLLAARSGANVENVNAGMAGIAVMGITTLMHGVNFPDVEPLLDEMMQCISVKPDPNHPDLTRPLIDRGADEDDIEEVATRVELRSEVLALHLGFPLADALSKLTPSSAPAETEVASSITPTSPRRSRR